VKFGAIIFRRDNAGAKTLKNIRAASETLIVSRRFFARSNRFQRYPARAMTAPQSEPSLLSMIPFATLLAAIALGPTFWRERWHKHASKVCSAFAAITVCYYLVALHSGPRVLSAGFEYASFIIVVGAFFAVASGIHLRVRGRSTPGLNAAFLVMGALLANLVGTVGASMLLVRPWIALNRSRFAAFHAAFFIFVVSNIGGVLLPIGPPLLLGFVKGVPFWWAVQRLWAPWLVALAAVIVVFWVWDRMNFRGSIAPARETEPDHHASGKWQCIGATNLLAMAGMLVTLVLVPAGWRELFIALIAVTAYWFTAPDIRRLNEFTFAPLKEIAWIFLGIFGTMIPVLDYMERHAGALGVHSDVQFFWITGLLSAVLDNAPAYLTFLAGALGLQGWSVEKAGHIAQFIATNDHSLVAISLGATFFGALTYIGNGPNLLVKAITEHARVPTPTFFGFIFKFALPVLIPIFLLISILFFR
jgi:Na+/H+ antiporter NhaD/arsenite permease-like protein